MLFRAGANMRRASWDGATLLSLVEQVQEQVDQEKAEKLAKRDHVQVLRSYRICAIS